MINYILHVSLLLGLGFILYQVLLKKETFYSLNRIILFSYLVLAFVLPSIHIPSEWSLRNEDQALISIAESTPTNTKNTKISPPLEVIDTESGGTITVRDKNNDIESVTLPGEGKITRAKNNTQELTTTKQQVSPAAKGPFEFTKWTAALRWIYLVGVSIFLINFLVQFSILIYYRLKYPTLKDGKMTIVEMPGDKAPFSFLNMIYINPTKYDYETYEQILAHEKIHITKWHSADIFLSELALIFQWFNPFAWYYRKAVEHNLEYLTDQEMLAAGANAEVYQMNLLRVSVPELPLALSTNYNQSFLKKRIQMMNAKKSSAQSTWKYLFILPILGLSISMMNPTFSTAQNDQSVDKNKEETKIQTTTDNLNLQPAQAESPLITPDVRSDLQVQNPKIEIINPMKAIENSDLDMQNISDFGISSESDLELHLDGDDLELVAEGKKTLSLNSTDEGRIILRSTDEDLLQEGIWEAEIRGSEVCFFIKKGGIGKNYYWSSSECMKASDFSPAIKKNSEGEFTLVREAGTMTFKGEFEGDNGTGRYDFKPNSSFLSYIKSQGFDIQEKKMIHFFLSDINKDYISFLKKEGYNNLDEDELLAMAIHGVNEEYIQDINGEFQKVNYGKPTAEELVAMRIHDVDLEYIKSFGKELKEELSVDQIISAAIHDVDPAYLSKFKEMGFNDLSFDDLVSAAIHDVDISYIKELKSGGIENISFDNIISASIHDVNPSYIQKFQDAGFKNLDFNDLISAAIHDVDPEYIQKFQEAGFENLEFEDMISAAIHDVDPDYIQTFQNAGFKNLDFDDMITASIHDISPNYVNELIDAGMKDLSFDNIVSFAIHDIDPSDIKELKEFGFELDADQMISAGIHNLTSRFIKKMQAKGYKDLSFEEYLKLKIHGF